MTFYALPSLLDPEQWLACRQSLVRANTGAINQLRNSLLLSERIVISDGFVFDNPALWELISESNWCEPLATACDVLSSSERRVDVDRRFRSWFFRPDGIVNPSAIRGPALDPAQRRRALERLTYLGRFEKFKDDLTFASYGEAMGLSEIQPSGEALAAFFLKCRLRKKNGHRRVEFGRYVRLLLHGGPTFFSQGIPKDERDRLERYVADREESEISRSDLARDYPLFWSTYAPLINSVRQLTFASHLIEQTGQVTINPGPGRMGALYDDSVLRSTEGIARRLGEVAYLLKCDDVPVDKILKVREQPRFRSCVRQLCVAEANLVQSQADPSALSEYEDALSDWIELLGPLLMNGRSKSAADSRGPSLTRKISADLASGVTQMALVALLTNTTGMPSPGLLGKLSALIGAVTTKYIVLNGTGRSSLGPSRACLSIRPQRSGPTV